MSRNSARQSDAVIRTGSEHFTIADAQPYHHPVGKIDYKGAGVYVRAYDARCPRCREERRHTSGEA